LRFLCVLCGKKLFALNLLTAKDAKEAAKNAKKNSVAIRAGVLRKQRPGEDADDPVEPGLQRYVIDLPDLGPVGTVDV